MLEGFGPPASVRYFPSKSGGFGPQGDEFIFIRDLSSGVMPIRGFKGSDSYKARLEPEDDLLEGVVCRLLDVGEYPHDDLAEAVSSFVENAVNYMAYEGEVFYEIAFTPERHREPAGVRLLPLPPGRVIRAPWGWYQLVPKADRQQIGKGRAIRLEKKSVWRITLPSRLGGARRYRRMLKVLGTTSSATPPFMMTRSDLGRGISYDLSAHDKACRIGTERATRRWGTMPSHFRVKETTEFFSFARTLAWRRSQAELRDHVLAELRVLLRRLGIDANLVVEGLTPPEEISAAMTKLQEGSVSVKEALDVGRD